MRRLRTISTRQLLAIAGAIVVLAGAAGIAQAALGGAAKPAPKPLDRAIVDAVDAPPVQGVTARIHFTNNLLPSGTLPQGSGSPVMTGADGRLWLSNDGRLRLELQSSAGDAQIVVADGRFSIYDAGSNTAYVGTLPSSGDGTAHPGGAPLTLAGVDKALAQLGKLWSVSGAQPGTTAGRPSYTVRIAPKDDGGLLGAAELAFDAAHGVPLRAAIYAQGQSAPVIELAATSIAYGKIGDATFDTTPPAGAKLVQLGAPALGTPSHGAGGAPVDGLAAVQKQVGFTIAAPDTLAGLPRKDVRLLRAGGETGAIVSYGQGLGAIAVIQTPAQPGGAGASGDLGAALKLPTVNVNGATGTELATALGTVVRFQHAGVGYVVLGSVPPLAAENAARALT